MQKASAKKQVKPNKPRKPKPKPKTQSWRKKVDWSAAERKAYEVLRMNKKRGAARSWIQQTTESMLYPTSNLRPSRRSVEI